MPPQFLKNLFLLLLLVFCLCCRKLNMVSQTINNYCCCNGHIQNVTFHNSAILYVIQGWLFFLVECANMGNFLSKLIFLEILVQVYRKYCTCDVFASCLLSIDKYAELISNVFLRKLLFTPTVFLSSILFIIIAN